MQERPPSRVLISAGEASGENYGAMLIPELRKLLGDETQFFGVGGEKMRAAGCETVIDSGKIAAVGITEVVKHVATAGPTFSRIPDKYCPLRAGVLAEAGSVLGVAEILDP